MRKRLQENANRKAYSLGKVCSRAKESIDHTKGRLAYPGGDLKISSRVEDVVNDHIT